MNWRPEKLAILDTHTGGEPTRVVYEGGPPLSGSLAEQREQLKSDFDLLRQSVILEPRGSEVLVGALLCRPENPRAAAGVIFFNNVGVIGMCGHGTIGVAVALAHLGRIDPGDHLLETPVGDVAVQYQGGSRVSLENVPCFMHRENVSLKLASGRKVAGDIAWGGNWFYLVHDHGEELHIRRVDELTRFTKEIRRALEAKQITGADGGVIDHIELLGPAKNKAADCQSFVLCPGGAYDRSPCGTGVSAKLACLWAQGKIKPGETFRVESIIGSMFEGSIREDASGRLIPRITGDAYVCGQGVFLFDPADPYRYGILP